MTIGAMTERSNQQRLVPSGRRAGLFATFLMHKSGSDQSSTFPGGSCAMGVVKGAPSAVTSFSTAM